MNKQVVTLSIIALLSIILAILIDWLFLIIAVVIMLINQRLLFPKKKSKEKLKKTKDI